MCLTAMREAVQRFRLRIALGSYNVEMLPAMLPSSRPVVLTTRLLSRTYIDAAAVECRGVSRPPITREVRTRPPSDDEAVENDIDHLLRADAIPWWWDLLSHAPKRGRPSRCGPPSDNEAVENDTDHLLRADAIPWWWDLFSYAPKRGRPSRCGCCGCRPTAAVSPRILSSACLTSVV